MSTPLLTLSMIVKNESEYLKRCLNTVKDVADQIVIVDTGSTDNTIQIAIDCGAEVYNYHWENNFSAARNFALSKSVGKYILYLDADEFLASKSIPEIRKIITSGKAGGFICKVLNQMPDGQNILMYYPRLFSNNPSIKFSGFVHEQIEPSLLENNLPLIKSDIEIIHTGYNKSTSLLEEKAKRNLAILLKEIEIHPSGYIYYQLGNTYAVLKDNNAAVKNYLTAFNVPDLLAEYKTIAGLYIAEKFIQTGASEKAFEILRQVFKLPDLSLSDLITLAELSQSFNNSGFTESIIHKTITELKYNPGLNKAVVKIESRYDIIIKLLNLIVEANNISATGEIEKHIPEELKDFIIYQELKSILISQNIDKLHDLLDGITDYGADALSKLINIFIAKGEKRYFLDLIRTKFESSEKVNLIYAESLIVEKKYTDALNILKRLVHNNPQNPSTYFYLISLLNTIGDKKEIGVYLNLLENNFSQNPLISPRIDVLRNKIQ